MRRSLELDAELGRALGEALACADVERHARPAPAVDEQAQGGEGLGERTRGHVLLVAVTAHLLAQNPALRVLAADS